MSANGVANLSERRNDVNAALMHLIEELTEQVHEMRAETLAQDRKRQEDRDALVARLLAECFPDGDQAAHRKYHENLIRRGEEQLAFWKKMREALVQWGLIGFAAWFVYFAGHAFWVEIVTQSKKW